MAGSTVRLADMTSVIEDGVKASQRRKRFDTGRRVADRADRVSISFRELLSVAGRTRDMTRHLRRRAIVIANVADKTGKSVMLRRIVAKSRVILVRRVTGGNWRILEYFRRATVRENDQ